MDNDSTTLVPQHTSAAHSRSHLVPSKSQAISSNPKMIASKSQVAPSKLEATPKPQPSGPNHWLEAIKHRLWSLRYTMFPKKTELDKMCEALLPMILLNVLLEAILFLFILIVVPITVMDFLDRLRRSSEEHGQRVHVRSIEDK